jgi:crotonobetainyl-CoA:carnitine CoA-transferase CaiB-like acyl-CoA transferase
MSQQPFEGLNVVEFGQFVAVPVASQLLADGGAKVIKVEPLSGDPMRSVSSMGKAAGESRHFICRNNGKHCLPLALSDALAKPVIEALLERADVVLMNLRPGLAEKLGIDPEHLLERYPRLVVGSVSGYGSTGPESGNVGQDVVLQARSGLMASNGRMIDGRPAACDTVTVDTMGAMTLAFGVSSALLRRERTGKGGVIETSLLLAAMTVASTDLARSSTGDAIEHQKKLELLAAKRAEGASYAEQLQVVQPAELVVLKEMMNVYYTTFATQDSFIAVACGSTSLQKTFCETLGVLDGRHTPNFAEDLLTHYKKLSSQVQQIIASQTSEHWVALLREAGVPVSKVFLPIELFGDEHINANNYFHSFEHPQVGPMTVVGSPLRLDKEEGFHPGQPTRLFGSESEAILSQLGFSKKEIDDLMAAGISHKGT